MRPTNGGSTVARRTLLQVTGGGAAAIAGCTANDGKQRPQTAPQAAESTPTVPEIVVYERDGTGYATTGDETYSGSGVFAAAQQAIDARIADDGGNVHVFVTQGEYDLTQGLLIDDRDVDRLYIGTAGLRQVQLNTAGIDAGQYDSVIEVNPRATEPSEYKERIAKVTIEGFGLTDEGRDAHTLNGIYLNDCNQIVVNGNNCRGGFKRGLYLRNCWQGQIDSIEVTRSGSNTHSTPAIQVGHPDDTKTYQAINHIHFSHLQGGRPEYAYLEVQGTATRIDISFPNVELGGRRGFVFDSSAGAVFAQIRGAQVNHGTPVVAIDDGARVEIVGGRLAGDTSAITAAGRGVPKLSVGGGIRLSGGTEPAVRVKNGWCNLAGFHITGGERGIVLDGVGMANISGGTVRDTNGAGISASHLTNNASVITGVNLINVAREKESPVVLDTVANLSCSTIAATTPREVPVVALAAVTNTAITNVIPAGAATMAYSADDATSLRNTAVE
jgi:parallel beta-helix repeat protein